MYSNLVSIVPKLLGVLVVIVLVADEEGAPYGTAIGVLTVWWEEDSAVEFPIFIVDGIVES